MNLTIRRATLADAEHIGLLGRVTFRETFGPYFEKWPDLEVYLNQTFNVAKLRGSLQKENNAFWLALADDLPVGFAKLKRFSPNHALSGEHPAQLQKIYVLSDFLAQKVGIALYDALLNEAQNSPATDLWLMSLSANERAIRFYERTGFTVVQPAKFTIGSQMFDFSLMNKPLAVI
ncbi:GNAT family N-acetyltransferase [Spirosoma montaniterrae]|uniref:N-acetyltransferase domain-containing protein n=1 Tax=Spirosoma montaniterrae TaxID=1178516 RepID=A0A1P9WWE6_9BACT|nr:GNAT family N-acetyltransferase [Spirosoma montaniterrae]AQG79683.1 hypothetical protein AWR27_10295 [Spirosoma montaniterrae]